MQPTVSYFPPTRSPATSLGVKENGMPSRVQNPSARPGLPSRLLPPGSPHVQKRFDSGAFGSASTAAAGSGRGIGSISTRPAPSRCRGEVVFVVPTRCRVTVAVGADGDEGADVLADDVPPVIDARLMPVTLQ